MRTLTGKEITEKRRQLKLSQEDLAKKAGVSVNALVACEGSNADYPHARQKISQYLENMENAEPNDSINKLLRTERERRGLNVRQAASACNTNHLLYGKVENGQVKKPLASDYYQILKNLPEDSMPEQVPVFNKHKKEKVVKLPELPPETVINLEEIASKGVVISIVTGNFTLTIKEN